MSQEKSEKFKFEIRREGRTGQGISYTAKYPREVGEVAKAFAENADENQTITILKRKDNE